jgi:hypothetical protein
MALWDSKENETVWIGTQFLAPSSEYSAEVDNPTKVKVVEKRKGKKDLVYWKGYALDVSLEGELREHPERFPGFPGREPSLSSSFDDFALSLPINPEEEKLISYTHFVYHRPVLALSNSAFGNQWAPAVELGTSSIINFRYRLGAAMQLPLLSPRFDWEDGERELAGVPFGLTFDLEWPLSDRLHLTTGLMAGGMGIDIRDPEDDETQEEGEELEDPAEASNDEDDFASILWPRARLFIGAKQGVQWGVGASYRYFYGIEEEILKRHPPAPWSVDLYIAFAFGGY